MREYITELSKYTISICMALYTYECFAIFNHRTKKKDNIYIRQNLLMFLIQLLCFADLAVVSKDIQYLFFYAFVQALLFLMLGMTKMVYENCNRLLLNNMCMLLGIGFVMVSRLSFQKVQKLYIIVMLSFLAGLILPWLLNRLTFLKKLTWIYAAAGILLLSIVLIMGEVTRGSKISYTIKGITFQPSEFVKILFIFFLAAALCENTSFRQVALTTVLAGIHVIVLVVSRDLGSALIFFTGFLFVVFIATRNYRYLLAGAAGGGLAAWAAYFIFDHVKSRVLAWQDPWSCIDKEGYQITQSLFAISSGSWFGTGLFHGNPTAIPDVETDFIFSAICEELGILFGICLILICMSCFVMMMDIASRQKDRFHQLISYGLGIMYIFQIFLTVGGGIKFIPLTGVTLPFVSYGGSSVLTTMIMFFIIQSLYIRLKKEGEKQLVRKKKTGKQS